MPLKVGTEAVGGLRIGTETVGGIKIGKELVYKTEAPATPAAAYLQNNATTFGNAGMPGWVQARNWGSAEQPEDTPATSIDWVAPSGATVSLTGLFVLNATHLRLNFAYPAIADGDFPRRVVLRRTLQVSGETRNLEAEVTIDTATFAQRGLGKQCDYDETSGDLFGSSATAVTGGSPMTVELWY